MTLGRLMELYQAEQQGKQIMRQECHHGYSSHRHTSEVKLAECELKDLVLDSQEDTTIIFFIKDEEDEFGDKLQ